MPTDPRLSHLKPSPRSTLFRAMDSILRADPAVKAVVQVFRSWQGKPTDNDPLAIGNAELAGVRLTPRGGPLEWWSTSAQMGTLFVDVETIVRGSCWEDSDSLYDALCRAFYPLDLAARNAVITRLQLAGAHKGLVEFSLPTFDGDAGDDDVILARGQFRIDYRETFWS